MSLVVDQNISKMAKPSISSDFSIDHILNRAGERFVNNKVEQCESINSEASSSDENCEDYIRNCCRIENERFIDIPNFDWLNYTRYNMPRIPRPSKPPAKRTPGRLPRIPFTPHQLNELENAYRRATYLSTEDANKLAKTLELTGVRVKIWFQNRRARDRRERKDLLYQNSSVKSFEMDNNSSCDVDDIIEVS